MDKPEEPVRIIIALEGGLVQAVLSDGRKVEALVVDYEVEGADEDELFVNPDGDEAYGHIEEAEVSPGRVDDFFSCYRKETPTKPKIVDGRIVLIETFISDGKGLVHTCTLSVLEEGYCADLYVFFPEEPRIRELWFDGTFLNNVMAVLQTLGYVGESFGRAELGVQMSGRVVLEGGDDFRDWVEEKYGWVDLEKAKKES